MSARDRPLRDQGAGADRQARQGRRHQACRHRRGSQQAAQTILGMRIGDYTVERLLVEEQAEIAREFYAAVLHRRRRAQAAGPVLHRRRHGHRGHRRRQARRHPPPVGRHRAATPRRPTSRAMLAGLDLGRAAGIRSRASLRSFTRPIARTMPSFWKSIRWRCSPTGASSRSTANSCSTMRRSTGRTTSPGRCAGGVMTALEKRGAEAASSSSSSTAMSACWPTAPA